MKFYILSDNVDSLVAMRLVGIEGEVIHEKHTFLEKLDQLIDDPSFGIILITTKLVSLAPHVISEYKLNLPRKIILEIPDRHVETDIGQTIDRYVSEAIGIKM